MSVVENTVQAGSKTLSSEQNWFKLVQKPVKTGSKTCSNWFRMMGSTNILQTGSKKVVAKERQEDRRGAPIGFKAMTGSDERT